MAFGACGSLTDIDIPDTVTGIGSEVFGNCHGLEKIKLPSRLESIGDNVFFNCFSLREISYEKKYSIGWQLRKVSRMLF